MTAPPSGTFSPLAPLIGAARSLARRSLIRFGHAVGRRTGRYYFEDFVRVYPHDFAYRRIGLRRRMSEMDRRNFRAHVRFYEFAAQFVRDKTVVDVGCGSGYGCSLLKEAGAAAVHGTDLSRHALRYARSHFAAQATFTRQSIVDLREYPDGLADVVVCSEVLEHIREYGLEAMAIAELARVARPGGLVVIGTPNTEILPDHGFAFHELHALLAARFASFRIFENALAPLTAAGRAEWQQREAGGRVGTVVSERIAEDAVPVPPGTRFELKAGEPPGLVVVGDYEVDTRLLHNPISWLAVGVNDPPGGRASHEADA